MKNFLKMLCVSDKEKNWQKFANEINAKYFNASFWKGSKVVANVKNWTITFDTYTTSSGKTKVTNTRIQAPYVSADGFRFKIYRKFFLSEIGKYFGMQDVEIGYPEFDNQFIIKGNDESKVRAMFMNEKIRNLIEKQPSGWFEVREAGGKLSSKLHNSVYNLYFQVSGVITEIDQLRTLYDLFVETLGHLCRLGSAYEYVIDVNNSE